MSFEFQGSYTLTVVGKGKDVGLVVHIHLYLDTASWAVRIVEAPRGMAAKEHRAVSRQRKVTESLRASIEAVAAGVAAVDPVIAAMRDLFYPNDRRYQWRSNAPGLLEIRHRLGGKVDGAKFSPLQANPPTPVDLSNLDLTGMQFTRCDFKGVNLTDAKLMWTIFRDCQFGGGTLRGAWCGLADFAGHHLAGIDLTKTDFSNANLTGARIENCTLKDTFFDGANLSTCNLTGLTFSGCRLDGANFRGADLSGSRLESCRARDTKCAGTVFRNATLKIVEFSGAILDDATFAGAELTWVNFDGAQLFRTDFTGVTLGPDNVRMLNVRDWEHEAKFGRSEATRTKFTRARLHTDVIGRDWSWFDCTDAAFTHIGEGRITATNAILTGVNFSGQTLPADFKRCTMHGASFANGNLEDSTFTDGTELRGTNAGRHAADFTGARLRGTRFDGADLTGVSFAGSDLWEATFERSTLVLTSFAFAFAPGIDLRGFTDKQMGGVDFSGAFLVSAKFQDATFMTWDSKAPTFANACLLGADFSGADLTDAILTNAKLAAESGTIVAALPARGGRAAATYEFSYEPSVVEGAKTGSKTNCPSGGPGPCREEQWRTEVPEIWRQPD